MNTIASIKNTFGEHQVGKLIVAGDLLENISSLKNPEPQNLEDSINDMLLSNPYSNPKSNKKIKKLMQKTELEFGR